MRFLNAFHLVGRYNYSPRPHGFFVSVTLSLSPVTRSMRLFCIWSLTDTSSAAATANPIHPPLKKLPTDFLAKRFKAVPDNYSIAGVKAFNYSPVSNSCKPPQTIFAPALPTALLAAPACLITTIVPLAIPAPISSHVGGGAFAARAASMRR